MFTGFATPPTRASVNTTSAPHQRTDQHHHKVYILMTDALSIVSWPSVSSTDVHVVESSLSVDFREPAEEAVRN